ncbi:DUF432 domain-containing protein [Pyrodictium delaneyi]|uniref:DUF432 domain-containing protein n=2 Tax=Pyrodictium delaneyi TaxID=1273541 RepID=A0A211YQ17_9CREN|nr:hypothetical protein Pdsh_04795 [Pyrodictium delaneyi]
MMFGHLAIGELRRVCGNTLSVSVLEDNRCRYKRGNTTVIVPCDSVSIYPAPPIFYPEHITNYIMIRFKEPIVVKPGSSEKFWTLVDFDVVAVVGSGSTSYEIVDAFPSTGMCKYALYGSPSRGILSRYIVTRVYGESKSEECRATIAINIVNKSMKPVKISRIVFPGHSFSLFYSQDSVIGSSLYVTVTSPFTAVVSLREPSISNMHRAPRLIEQRVVASVQPRWSQSFVMSYGL